MIYLVTGIGTDVGKTVVAAILAKALDATYWKPIQAGDLKNSDSIKVHSYTKCPVIPELFKLSQPMSPHAAAEIDGIEIDVNEIEIPEVVGDLVIEGAGGIMVPINTKGETFLDLFEKWNQPILVVSRHYLGSINHTLLTVESIMNRGLSIEGIIFVGDKNPTTESIIETSTNCKIIGRIPLTTIIDSNFIEEQAANLLATWKR